MLVFKGGRVVEEGDALRVFVAPEHPYTRLLMAATPALRRAQPRTPAEAPEVALERELS